MLKERKLWPNIGNYRTKLGREDINLSKRLWDNLSESTSLNNESRSLILYSQSFWFPCSPPPWAQSAIHLLPSGHTFYISKWARQPISDWSSYKEYICYMTYFSIHDPRFPSFVLYCTFISFSFTLTFILLSQCTDHFFFASSLPPPSLLINLTLHPSIVRPNLHHLLWLLSPQLSLSSIKTISIHSL